MTRKIISLFLVAAMLLTLVPASVFAADVIDSYLQIDGFPTTWVKEHTDFSITVTDEAVTAMTVNGETVEYTAPSDGGGTTPGTRPYVKYKVLDYDEEAGVLSIGAFIGNFNAGSGVFTLKYDAQNWAIYDEDCGEELTEIDGVDHAFDGCFMKGYMYSDRNSYKLASGQAKRYTVTLMTEPRSADIDFENGVAYVTWNIGGSKIDATAMEMPVFRFSLIKKGNGSFGATTITEPAFSELTGDPSVSSTSASTQIFTDNTLYASAVGNMDYVTQALDGTMYGVAEATEGGFSFKANTADAVNGEFVVNITANGTPYSKTLNVLYDNEAPTLEVVPADTGAPTNKNVTFTLNASDSKSGIKELSVNGTEVNVTTYVAETSGTYTFKAVDNAGNETTVVRTVTIDKDAPTIIANPDVATAPIRDVIIGIETEAGATITVSKDGGAEETVTGSSYTVTENGTYTFTATDAAGNSASTDVVVENIDREAPELVLTPDITAPTNKDVVITIATNESVTVTVSKDGEDAVAVEGDTYAAKENGIYTFTATDAAGNTTTEELEIENIDKDAPELTVTPDITEPTNTDVTIAIHTEADATVTVSKDSEDPVVVNGGSYLVAENGEYIFTATDAAGNVTTRVLNIENIDKVPLVLEITGNPTDWVSGYQNFKISANKDKFTLTVNGETVPGSSYLFKENGPYTFFATDEAGNTYEEVITVTKFDKTAPTILINEAPTEWTNSFTLIIDATDYESGINSYYINGAIYYDASSWDVPGNDTYEISVWDNVGNQSEILTLNVTKLDKDLPTIEISGAPEGWVKKATLTVLTDDETSGVASVTVSKDGGDAVAVEGDAIDVTENGTYKFVVTDYAGNKAEETVTISTVDSEEPVVQILGNPESWVKSAELVIDAKDAVSGIKEITVNGNDFEGGTYTVTENGRYKFVVTDYAGNSYEDTVNVARVDGNAPSLTVSGVPTEAVKSHTFTYSASDGEKESGLLKVTVSKDGGSEAVLNNGEYTVKAGGKYVFTAYDNVGNTTVVEREIPEGMIDNNAPVVTVTGVPEGWAKADVTLSVVANKTAEVVAMKNGVNVGTVSGTTYIATESGTYKFVATDALGNVGESDEYKINIDKVDPEITIDGDISEDWVAFGYNISFNVIEEDSGIESITVNGAENYDYSFDASENRDYTIVVTDNAGRTATKVITVRNIDNTNPVIEIISELPTTWVKEYTVTFTVADKQSGIESVTVNGENVEFASGVINYLVTANGDLEIVVKDKVGNVETASVVFDEDVVDTEAPFAEISEVPTAPCKSFVLTIDARDSQSGVASVTVNGIPAIENDGVWEYTIEENGEYTVKVTDNVGREYESEKITVECVDNDQPVISFPGFSEDEWTKEDRVITVSVNKEIETLTVSKDGEEAVPVEGDTFTATENGTYTFTATDAAGNVGTKVLVISKIDKTVPEISVSGKPDGFVKQFVANVEAKDSVSAITVTVSKDDGDPSVVSGTTYPVVENGTYVFTVTDMAGNTAEDTMVVENIDNNKPTLESVSYDDSEYSKEKIITIVFNDESPLTITVNGEPYDESGFIATENGPYIFVATDAAGNTETKEVTITKIDNTAPEVNVNEAPTEWTNSFTLRIDATDNQSGVASIKVNGEEIDGTTYEVPGNDTYKVVAVDNLGNESEPVTVLVGKLDKEAPAVSGITGNPETWVQSAELVIDATDALSGIKEIRVNGALFEGTTYTVTENREYIFTVTDNAGNSFESEPVTVTMIDRVEPTIGITGNTDTVTISKELSYVASDDASGIKSITVSKDGGEAIDITDGTSYEVTANGTYEFVVTDNAGNVKSENVVVAKVDEKAPVFEGELKATDVTTNSITVSLPKATDDFGVMGYELYLNEIKVEGYEGAEVHTFEGLTEATSYAIKLVAIDNVARTTELKLDVETLGLGKIEATVDLSGISESPEKLHMNVYLGDKMLPVGNDGKVAFEGLAEGTYTLTFKAAGFFNIGKAEIVVTNDNTTKVDFKKNELVAGDTTANGKIDIYDLNAVASAFAESYDGETGLIYDFNRDGKVDASDIKILVTNYSKVMAE